MVETMVGYHQWALRSPGRGWLRCPGFLGEGGIARLGSETGRRTDHVTLRTPEGSPLAATHLPSRSTFAKSPTLPSPPLPVSTPPTRLTRRRRHSLTTRLRARSSHHSLLFCLRLATLCLAVLSTQPIPASPPLHSSHGLNTLKPLRKPSTLTSFVDISGSCCITLTIFSLLSSLTLPSLTFPRFGYYSAVVPSFPAPLPFIRTPHPRSQFDTHKLPPRGHITGLQSSHSFRFPYLFSPYFTLPCPPSVLVIVRTNV